MMGLLNAFDGSMMDVGTPANLKSCLDEPCGLFCHAKPRVRTHIQKTFCWMVRSGGRIEIVVLVLAVQWRHGSCCAFRMCQGLILFFSSRRVATNRWRRKAPMAACHNV